jgi:hypothetical protein
MNKIGALFEELHDAETALHDQLRVVGERHAADHDIWHMCHQLAEQSAARAEQVRQIAPKFQTVIDAPSDNESLHAVAATLRHKASEMLGRQPEGGLLLLRDLRALFRDGQEVNVLWLIVGQVSQTIRDDDLLDVVTPVHKQVLTQIKWLKTHIKELAPQALCVPAP